MVDGYRAGPDGVVRQKLKAFTASRLLKFEKRIQVHEMACIDPTRTGIASQGEKCPKASQK